MLREKAFRDPIKHFLKIWPGFFEAVTLHLKTFEIRRNDRDYQPKDRVVLQEFSPVSNSFTGKELEVEVEYVLENVAGIERGYCVFGFRYV